MNNHIKPHIKIGEPGQPITLYQGQLEAKVGTESFIIDNSSIIFVFLPKPRIQFHFIGADSLVMKLFFDQNSNFEIKLPDHNVFIDVFSLHKSTEKSSIIALQARKADWSFIKQLSSIKFYIPNFPNILSSIKFEFDQWILIINPLNNFSSIKDFLNYSNNYAATHICRLENSNSKVFNLEVANDLINAIYYFLSFSRGFWVAPILIYGYDENHKKVWENLENNVDNWQFVRSWLPLVNSNSIEKAFIGFWDKWKDNEWKEIIKLSIYWYVSISKQSGGQEGSIILTQAALEMLANVVLVEDKNIISSSGFEKLNASDKIRLLLNQCYVPLEIPSSLTELDKYAKKFNYSSGSETITILRNNLIHPKLKNRETFLEIPLSVIRETYLLGKWYLELVLLYLFNYQGNYINYTKPQPYYYSDGDSVPWNDKNS